MITHSGVWVDADTGVPTPEDIAIQLGRTTRWAGTTSRYYSVLHHSMVCLRIAATLSSDATTLLACLLHDAHEAMTGDIPSPIKPEAIKAIQAKIDARIGLSLNLPALLSGEAEHRGLVDAVDERALLAEASLLLAGPAWKYFDTPYPTDLLVVSQVIGEYPKYEDYLEIDGRMIRDFLALRRSLAEGAKLR